MGNYRFKLSDMIPNAWFHKLKDMSKTTTTIKGRNARSHIRQSVKKSKSPSSSPSSSAIKKHPGFFYQKPPESQLQMKPGRASYYIPSGGGGGGGGSENNFPEFPVNLKGSETKYLTDPPRKSNKKTRGGGGRSGTSTSTTKLVSSSVSSVCNCQTTEHSSAWRAEFLPPPPSLIPYSLWFYDDKPVISCNNRTVTPTDIVIDNNFNPQTSNDVDCFPTPPPPPIRTKPAAVRKKQPDSTQKPDQRSPRRRTSAGIQRLRTRANSPRVFTKKTTTTTTVLKGGRKPMRITTTPRKGISGSFAVVKSSVDPDKDFRESMVEMIAANNIRSPKDLEELLVCYLSLNSDEYHDVIVKVFEQIWFELTNLRKL